MKQISIRTIVASFASVATSVAIYLVASLSPVVFRDDWSWETFRRFGSGDQLSYLAFAVNAFTGESTNLEPFTETGSATYPRAYYVFLGHAAGLLHIHPAASWMIFGAISQACLVTAIAVASIILTRRPWVGVLAFIPLTVGTFASIFNEGFYWPLQSHAVLWGAFATYFPMNGEGFGLAIAGIAGLLAIVTLLAGRDGARYSQLIFLVVAGLIGGLANVQTYVFIAAAYLAIYSIAVYGMVEFRRRWIWALSFALSLTVFLVGPKLAEHTSPLVALIFGLLPATPGFLVMLNSLRWRLIRPIIAAMLCASPVLISLGLAIYKHDEFLAYRTESSHDLGVQVVQALAAGLILLIALVVIFISGLKLRINLFVSLVIGPLAAWFLLSTNDLWGANQEPYRFWIDLYALIAALTFPLLLWTIFQGSTKKNALEILSASSEGEPPTGVFNKSQKIIIATVLSCLTLLSFYDTFVFYQKMYAAPLIELGGGKNHALKVLADKYPKDIFIVDNCIDPLAFKAVTGARVAFMNVGMAWPDHRNEIMNINVLKGQDIFDIESARNAGIKLIITDDGCDQKWLGESRNYLEKIDQEFYDGDSFSVFRIVD